MKSETKVHVFRYESIKRNVKRFLSWLHSMFKPVVDVLSAAVGDMKNMVAESPILLFGAKTAFTIFIGMVVVYTTAKLIPIMVMLAGAVVIIAFSIILVQETMNALFPKVSRTQAAS